MYGITNTVTVNFKRHQLLKDKKIEKHCSNKDLRVAILINQNYNHCDFFKGRLKERIERIFSHYTFNSRHASFDTIGEFLNSFFFSLSKLFTV